MTGMIERTETVTTKGALCFCVFGNDDEWHPVNLSTPSDIRQWLEGAGEEQKIDIMKAMGWCPIDAKVTTYVKALESDLQAARDVGDTAHDLAEALRADCARASAERDDIRAQWDRNTAGLIRERDEARAECERQAVDLQDAQNSFIMLSRIETLMGSDEPGCLQEWEDGEDLHDSIAHAIVDRDRQLAESRAECERLRADLEHVKADQLLGVSIADRMRPVVEAAERMAPPDRSINLNEALRTYRAQQGGASTTNGHAGEVDETNPQHPAGSDEGLSPTPPDSGDGAPERVWWTNGHTKPLDGWHYKHPMKVEFIRADVAQRMVSDALTAAADRVCGLIGVAESVDPKSPGGSWFWAYIGPDGSRIKIGEKWAGSPNPEAERDEVCRRLRTAVMGES